MTQEQLTAFLKIERHTFELSVSRFLETLPKSGVIPELSPSRWATILTYYPELNSFCSNFEAFSKKDWLELLARQPQFASRCNGWETFTPDNWQTLLRYQPQLYGYCEKKDDPVVICGLLGSGTVAVEQVDTAGFTVEHWFWAVKYNPAAWASCSCKEPFSNDMWWSILATSPSLVSSCPCLQEFDEHEKTLLTRVQPCLEFILDPRY